MDERSPPRLLGPYCLLQPLAEGGMGAVYIATALDEPGDTLCLIKTLKPGTDQGSDEYLRRFLDEARVALQLQGEHLCHVFDGGEVDGVRFLAMELIEGVTFRRLTDMVTASGEALPEAQAVTLGLGMLRGLHAAHTAHDDQDRPLNVVHRDVSPQNVMADRFGQVKVIDFGLATSTLKETVTEQAVVMGKMAYMAPEQARGEPVTAAADQYAAAVVLYELLTGDRYYGDLPSRGIWGIVGAGTHQPRSWDRVPGPLAPVLARALSAAPWARYPDCAAFADALEAAAPSTNPTARRVALREWLAPRLGPELQPVEQARAALQALPPSIRQAATEATQRVRVRLQGVKSSVSTAELMRPIMVAGPTSSSGSASIPLSPGEGTEAFTRAAVVAPTPARSRPVAPAIGLLAVVIVAVVAAVATREPPPAVAVAVAPAPLPPSAPPIAVPAPALVVVEPPAPVVVEPPAPVVAPAPPPPPVVVTRKKSEARTKFEARVAKLIACREPCADGLRKSVREGLPASPTILQLCEQKCGP